MNNPGLEIPLFSGFPSFFHIDSDHSPSVGRPPRRVAGRLPPHCQVSAAFCVLLVSCCVRMWKDPSPRHWPEQHGKEKELLQHCTGNEPYSSLQKEARNWLTSYPIDCYCNSQLRPLHRCYNAFSPVGWFFLYFCNFDSMYNNYFKMIQSQTRHLFLDAEAWKLGSSGIEVRPGNSLVGGFIWSGLSQLFFLPGFPIMSTQWCAFILTWHPSKHFSVWKRSRMERYSRWVDFIVAS